MRGHHFLPSHYLWSLNCVVFAQSCQTQSVWPAMLSMNHIVWCNAFRVPVGSLCHEELGPYFNDQIAAACPLSPKWSKFKHSTKPCQRIGGRENQILGSACHPICAIVKVQCLTFIFVFSPFWFWKIFCTTGDKIFWATTCKRATDWRARMHIAHCITHCNAQLVLYKKNYLHSSASTPPREAL